MKKKREMGAQPSGNKGGDVLADVNEDHVWSRLSVCPLGGSLLRHPRAQFKPEILGYSVKLGTKYLVSKLRY